MDFKIIILTVVISAVIVVCESEQKCDKKPGFIREKRSKYYSNPPQRFYRRPPMTYPVKGAFSYTPPPFYANDNADSFPPGSRPPKVSKKSRTDGLGDEDINNIVKYLSKHDLDKLIEVAYEKDKYNKDVPFEYSNPPSKDDSHYKSVNIEQYKDVPFEYSNKPVDNFQVYKNYPESVSPNLGSPDFYTPNNDQKSYEIEYDGPPTRQENLAPRIISSNNFLDSANTPFDVQESMQHSQIAFFNKHIIEDNVHGKLNSDNRELYTGHREIKEEIPPRPVNLREDDYYGSFTHNVPTVVKSESSAYKLENFGDLPLMNYNSKLDSVSSYHVPHYTVTTHQKKPAPYSAPSPPQSSSLSNVPLEPAPPVSEAKAQSDAHLKAIRIWTHRSKGTAYYLHSDGSLSLEAPKRPKPYGP